MRLRRLVPMIVLTAVLCWHIRDVGAAFRRAYGYVQSQIVAYEMNGIRQSLVTLWQGQNALPQPGAEFDAFVRQSFHKSDRDPVVDRFGHRYTYTLQNGFLGRVNGFRIVSAGPDGRMRTADDIVVAWQAPPEANALFTGRWEKLRGGRSAPR